MGVMMKGEKDLLTLQIKAEVPWRASLLLQIPREM